MRLREVEEVSAAEERVKAAVGLELNRARLALQEELLDADERATRWCPLCAPIERPRGGIGHEVGYDPSVCVSSQNQIARIVRRVEGLGGRIIGGLRTYQCITYTRRGLILQKGYYNPGLGGTRVVWPVGPIAQLIQPE